MAKISKLHVVLAIFVGLAAVLLIARFVVGGPEDSWVCTNGEWVKHGNPRSQKPTEGCQLIGGQKDEHGCLIPAGYSWCEISQKCLRVWEEPCEKPSDNIIQDGLVYTSPTFGFKLALPETWEGYKASQGDYPAYSYVGFSFNGNRQPFTVFQIVIFTKEQWEASGKSPLYKILDQNDARVLVCDGCCYENADTTGGGQFDDFQQARCKEVPEIIKSFTKN